MGKLLYLSQVGDNYDWEEGTSGGRTIVLGALEGKLTQFIVDKANAEQKLLRLGGALNTAPVAGESSFQRARRLQTEAIERQTMRSVSPKEQLGLDKSLRAEIADADAKIQRLTRWLQLEGAHLNPDGTINWTLSNAVVVYDHDAAVQQLTKLRFHGGRIFTDDAHANLFDTTDMVTHFSGPGKAIYVMTKEGNIHASSHSVGHRHHSSLLAGEKTAGSGELEVKDGVLKWISNKSGHYQPGLRHFMQTLHILEKHQISNSFRISYVNATGKREFANTTEFQAQLLAEGARHWDYELNKLLLYSHHLTDAVLSRHTPNSWRWRDPSAGEEPGVYDTVTRTLVPHRDVRRWLKSRNLFMKKVVKSGTNR
ncbi:MAG TPA: hypothetical protein VME23_10575 [Terracidiphilus sp.]|nr:hypothetical protein [Terracidiphilus sp.]